LDLIVININTRWVDSGETWALFCFEIFKHVLAKTTRRTKVIDGEKLKSGVRIRIRTNLLHLQLF